MKVKINIGKYKGMVLNVNRFEGAGHSFDAIVELPSGVNKRYYGTCDEYTRLKEEAVENVEKATENKVVINLNTKNEFCVSNEFGNSEYFDNLEDAVQNLKSRSQDEGKIDMYVKIAESSTVIKHSPSIVHIDKEFSIAT